MSKKNKNQEMESVRLLIDKIDNKMIPLMIKRSKLVEKAVSLKSKKSDIVDRKRINQILKKIESISIKMKTDPKLLKSIWMSMISNFIEYEKKEFEKNK